MKKERTITIGHLVNGFIILIIFACIFGTGYTLYQILDKDDWIDLAIILGAIVVFVLVVNGIKWLARNEDKVLFRW